MLTLAIRVSNEVKVVAELITYVVMNMSKQKTPTAASVCVMRKKPP